MAEATLWCVHGLDDSLIPDQWPARCYDQEVSRMAISNRESRRSTARACRLLSGWIVVLDGKECRVHGTSDVVDGLVTIDTDNAGRVTRQAGEPIEVLYR